MRRVIAFDCVGETLIGSLDVADGATGLLIVSGGNEVRCGAHRGMALLAADIAAAGYPVLRYDRRGIGDSSGCNAGFLSSEPDIMAAVAAFRLATPGLTTIVGFGNCDAATALALFGRNAGVDRVLLANPWTIDEADALPPTAAIRAHYAERLRSPREWLRAARGGMDLRKAASGLRKIVGDRTKEPGPLALRLNEAISKWGKDAAILLAKGDATAIAYRAVASENVATQIIDTDSHSFARSSDKIALRRVVIASLNP
jgi:exosortase A-associated hydrolase 1